MHVMAVELTKFAGLPFLPHLLLNNHAWSPYGRTGLSVIGLYLIASLKDFEKSTKKLCAIAKQARTDQADGSFLLHIEPATGKVFPAGCAFLMYVPMSVILPQIAILCSGSRPMGPWWHPQAHRSEHGLGRCLMCSFR